MTDEEISTNEVESTPLHVAADNGDAEAVTALLKAGAKPNGQDEDGVTPLHNVRNLSADSDTLAP